jgi:filamentous hemagglutinin
MKLRDIVNQIAIDPRKLTEYALNPNSPKGSNKAVVFEAALEFNLLTYERLLDQIVSKALDAEATIREKNQYGQRYRIDLEIIGVQGQPGIVRTGWIVPTNRDIAKLTTLYVLE